MPFNTPQTHDVTALRAAAQATDQLASLQALLWAPKRRPLADIIAALPAGMTSADLVLRGGRLVARPLTDDVQKRITLRLALQAAHKSLRLGSHVAILPVRSNTALIEGGVEIDDWGGTGHYTHRLDSELLLIGPTGALLSVATRGEIDIYVNRIGEAFDHGGATTLVCNGELLLSAPNDEYRRDDPVWDGGIDEPGLQEFALATAKVLGKPVNTARAKAILVAFMGALVPRPAPHYT